MTPSYVNGHGGMDAAAATAIFAALSQPTRLEAYRLLLRYQPFGLAAGDVARLLAVPHNTLSTHLALLQRCGLVVARRDGRSVILAAAPERLAAATAFLGQGASAHATHDDRPPAKREPAGGVAHNVLILCTANSARSIMAEAIVNREGLGRFRAFSAGSEPKGRVHPLASDLLRSLGYQTADLASKSWTAFAGARAPRMDIVITVCDVAAGEICPRWRGHPLSVHWGIADPAAVGGTHAQRRAAFADAYQQLMLRMTALINLPIERLSMSELRRRLDEIGRMDGATPLTFERQAA